MNSHTSRTSLLAIFSFLACLASVQSHAQSGLAANSDLYGHVLFESPKATNDDANHRENGLGDSYGSVLLDSAPLATTNATVERGQGDNYGSILLDIKWNKQMVGMMGGKVVGI
jgi:hypothetical protein